MEADRLSTLDAHSGDTEMTRKNLALWGYNPNPNYGLTQPIKLADYRSQKQQDQWRKEGWVTGVYGAGDEPLGLMLVVDKMRKESQLMEASR